MHWRLALVLLAASPLASCADIIEAQGPSTRIYSEPKVARCILTGAGQEAGQEAGFERLVHTPIRVVLPKSASPVTVTCDAPGYRSSTHRLVTDVNQSIAANLMFGTAIGLAVDIMSGAAEQYPSRILIHLEPLSFASAVSRDEWFGRFNRSVAGKWNGIIDRLRISCEEDLESPEDCREELKRTRMDRARDLRALERRRAEAPVHTESQARTPPPPPPALTLPPRPPRDG